MPTMVKLEVSPDFKPGNQDQKDMLVAAKKRGTFECDYSIALDNVLLSGGLYRIVPMTDPYAAPPPVIRELKDYSNSELKVMLLTLGIATDKQMRKADIVNLIQSKLDEVEIVED